MFKNRFLSLLALVLFLFSFVFVATGCDDDDSKDKTQIVDDDDDVTPADDDDDVTPTDDDDDVTPTDDDDDVTPTDDDDDDVPTSEAFPTLDSSKTIKIECEAFTFAGTPTQEGASVVETGKDETLVSGGSGVGSYGKAGNTLTYVFTPEFNVSSMGLRIGSAYLGMGEDVEAPALSGTALAISFLLASDDSAAATVTLSDEKITGPSADWSNWWVMKNFDNMPLSAELQAGTEYKIVIAVTGEPDAVVTAPNLDFCWLNKADGGAPIVPTSEPIPVLSETTDTLIECEAMTFAGTVGGYGATSVVEAELDDIVSGNSGIGSWGVADNTFTASVTTTYEIASVGLRSGSVFGGPIALNSLNMEIYFTNPSDDTVVATVTLSTGTVNGPSADWSSWWIMKNFDDMPLSTTLAAGTYNVVIKATGSTVPNLDCLWVSAAAIE